MSANHTPNDLFQEAARDFRAFLSPSESEEFTEFQSPEEMIKELRHRVSSRQEKSKLLEYCKRLEKVSDSLSPYFDIIGIFIQSNPEVPALVWGALRMVFLLASNYSSFLDKLLVMFEKISDRLPGYAEYYERLLARQKLAAAGASLPEFERTRVVKVLSYIYKDLVQFCQEACEIFVTTKRGMHRKAAAFAKVFWKPFDVRFENILERIETHQALFLSEMQLEEYKFTEFQFQKSQDDSNEIKLQLSELRKTILDRELKLIAHFERIAKHVPTLPEDQQPGMHRGNSNPRKISPIFDTTFRQTVKWINASDFSRAMDKAQKTRLDDTGKWFLASQSYTAFKSLEARSMGNRPETPKMQIMFIQAKPGYGKTIMSSLLIEDLANPPERDDSKELEAQDTLQVLYYHFSSERPGECSPTYGLRACLHQIVHYHTKTPHVLDVLSIITEMDSTGQIRATDEIVRQCLQLLLRKLPPLTLVFDGLDECTTPPELFRTVYELCCFTGSKAVFLGRPNFEPPRDCHLYTVINLQPSHNVRDIHVYLQHKIECLKSDGLLPASADTEKIVKLLAECAQGMFLWARLIIRYLFNPWLSPRERANTIYDNTMLDGLGSLFGKILAILEQSHPPRREKVHRIFQTMAISRTPFTLPELRQVVAVQPGRATHEEDFIVDFQNCLSAMCGSLVEYDSGGHVRFIHSSFRDYIMNSQYCRHSPLAITKQSSWLTLTTICLSYLTHDIPKRSITATLNQHSEKIAGCFPLLEYGMDRLQQLDHDIFQGDIPPSTDELQKAKQLLQALEEWIGQKLSVTVWLEANFFYHKISTLKPLISTMKIWCLRYKTHRARAAAIVSLYLQLEQDLDELCNDWGKVLFDEPCAIWTSTVTAFANSSFWFTQRDTIVTHLGQRPLAAFELDRMSDHTPHIILVKSQTAADKMTHATVHVIPSDQYVNAINQAATSGPENLLASRREGNVNFQNLCANWKVQYQLRDISSQSILFSAILDLPMADVLEMLRLPMHPDDQQASTPWSRIRLPVKISSDLTLVLIQRTLLILQTSAAIGHDGSSGTRTMDFKQLRCQPTTEASSPDHHYESMFSPMEDAIIFFATDSSSRRSQRLEVWSKKDSPPGSATEYVFRGRRRVRSLGKMTFLVHPTRPLLICTGMIGRTEIWYYNETKNERSYPFPQKTIEPVAFEDDVFLTYYSWNLSTDDPEVDAGDARFDSDGVFSLRSTWPLERIELLGADGVERRFQTSSVNRPEPTRPVIKTDPEELEDSLQIERSGYTNQKVMLRSRNGRSAQFGHIPRLQRWEHSSMTLLPIVGPFKIIWDKELQHSYSILDTPSRHLPCLIERTSQSIHFSEKTRTGDPGQTIDHHTPSDPKKRPREEEDDDCYMSAKEARGQDDSHRRHQIISVEHAASSHA